MMCTYIPALNFSFLPLLSLGVVACLCRVAVVLFLLFQIWNEIVCTIKGRKVFAGDSADRQDESA